MQDKGGSLPNFILPQDVARFAVTAHQSIHHVCLLHGLLFLHPLCRMGVHYHPSQYGVTLTAYDGSNPNIPKYLPRGWGRAQSPKRMPYYLFHLCFFECSITSREKPVTSLHRFLRQSTRLRKAVAVPSFFLFCPLRSFKLLLSTLTYYESGRP